jgi:hypothetical protein
MNLHDTLQAILSQANEIIMAKVRGSKDFYYSISTLVEATNGADHPNPGAISSEFVKRVPKLDVYIDGVFDDEGLVACYPLTIYAANGWLPDMRISLLDEEGVEHDILLADLDAKAITMLADWLAPKEEDKACDTILNGESAASFHESCVNEGHNFNQKVGGYYLESDGFCAFKLLQPNAVYTTSFPTQEQAIAWLKGEITNA